MKQDREFLDVMNHHHVISRIFFGFFVLLFQRLNVLAIFVSNFCERSNPEWVKKPGVESMVTFRSIRKKVGQNGTTSHSAAKILSIGFLNPLKTPAIQNYRGRPRFARPPKHL
jgi:hypothetical protein